MNYRTKLPDVSAAKRGSFEQASHTGFDLTRPAQALQHSQAQQDSLFLEHYSFHEHLSIDQAASDSII